MGFRNIRDFEDVEDGYGMSASRRTVLSMTRNGSGN